MGQGCDVSFYLGIDPSLTATGIVVLDDHANVFMQTVITSKHKGTKRLVDLREQTKKELGGITPAKMITVFIERYSFGSRLGQAFSIGEWGGVLRALLSVMKFKEVIEVSPQTLKKFITGRGNVQKDMILKEVFKKWGVDFDDDNLADSYGLARMNWSRDNMDLLTKADKEVIEKVLKCPF